MHDQKVFEKGDIVYTAALRTIGLPGSYRYAPVLFKCMVKCARRDYRLNVDVIEATVSGEKLTEVPHVSMDAYPPTYLFDRTPYEAMTRLRETQENYVESARAKLAEFEAHLKLINADPLLKRRDIKLNPSLVGECGFPAAVDEAMRRGLGPIMSCDDSRPANQPGDDVLVRILTGEEVK